MTARCLSTKYVEKPWGRDTLPALFPDGGGKRIGEVWFDGPEGEHPPLLIKYLFTSERLSIQVHPNDAQGQARGLPGGKSECWLVLEADPGATLGMGTLEPLDGETLRAASLDGRIEQLMDWKPVEAGDFFYIPAGTVHAIGAGIVLVEVQQNVDVTYRLYDYGRPRELHLDDGVAVSVAAPYARAPVSIEGKDEAVLLGRDEAPFALQLLTLAGGATLLGSAGTQSWFVPLGGAGMIDGQPWSAGQCWLLDGAAALDVAQSGKALLATL
jgi:mannose-6-phosphate isomerase